MNQQHEEPNVYDIVYNLILDKVIDPELLFVILEIFQPTFVTKGRHVFLKERFSKEYHERLTAEGANLEYWINLVTVDDFFSEMEDWEEKSSQFAQALVPMWRAKLKRDFPERKFVVKYLCDEEVGDYGLTFYQPKEDSL
jgi:hypothetical protein